MSGNTADHLRHHPARRRAGARLFAADRREAEAGAPVAQRSGVDIIEAGFPIASEADAEAVRMVATHVRGPVIAALARCHAEGHRARRLGARAGAAPPHPRLHRDVRPAPRAQAAHDARGVPAHRDGRGPPRAQLHRRRAVLGGRRDAQRSASSCGRSIEAVIQAGAKTINLPDTVGYSTPDEVADFFQDRHRARARAPTRSPSARTATTISGSRSPTRWRRSTPARARSSARSTASASAPATRRSKRS